jgi:hypothetical protein
MKVVVPESFQNEHVSEPAILRQLTWRAGQM